MNIIESVENFLCDTCDEAFKDGILCDKIYNAEQSVNRAAFVLQVLNPVTDQDGVTSCTAQIIENREKRSQCVQDMEIIRENFTKYGYKLQDGLVIYSSIQYITSPLRTVVGTQDVYTISAVINIKVR